MLSLVSLGELYLTHVTTEDGRGRTIARCIYSAIKTTDLEDKLAIIGSDGTATMTGPYNDAIRCLEELLGRPLQWAICLLHCNELSLRHVFITIDGKTESPETFFGKIGKELSGCVSEWPIADFKAISNPHFPLLLNEVVDDLSADQHYAYRICWAVILGDLDADLALLEVGPICHARWLTLACRLLRRYTSTVKYSASLNTLAEFCIRVYFPSWFEIKHKHNIIDGSKNFFNIIRRIQHFPDKQVKDIALKVVQRNSFLLTQRISC